MVADKTEPIHSAADLRSNVIYVSSALSGMKMIDVCSVNRFHLLNSYSSLLAEHTHYFTLDLVILLLLLALSAVIILLRWSYEN